MKLSVIIPAIDEAKVIGQAIDSALCAGAHEVILADGGSTDDTCRIAAAAGAQILVVAPGRAAQQNAAARVAQGDTLLFLHADCLLPVSAAQEIDAQLSLTVNCVGGYFRQRIDHPGSIYRWIERGNLLRARTLKWAYGDQAIFVRRSVFEQVGCFPDLAIMEDLFLMKRLKRAGSLVCIDGPLQVSARRWEERGTVRQTLRNWAMLAAAHLGVSPNVLARYYPRTT